MLARSDRALLWRAVTGSCWKLRIYAVDLEEPLEARAPLAARFTSLSETDLAAIPDHAGDASFRQRQEQSLRVFGKSFAFGVYMGDSLAHVSWLLSPEALSRETLQVLRLKAGEAEITGCETLPEFRRQGLYCFAIRQICAAARASGVHRIYMKTLEENKASQAGIIKAGLKRVGSIRMWTPPLMPSRVVVLRAIR